MNRLPRYAIIFALSFGYAGLLPAARSQTNTPKKSPPSTVSGRITLQGKGAPGIVVSIRNVTYSPQPRPSLKATTDQDGYYRIADIPAGQYQVVTLAPAYVSLDQGPYHGRGKLLLLAENENVEGIDFSLERGGVITGKVTDEDGRPVVEQRLALVPAEQANQQGQRSGPVVPNSFQTDDRGIYRIYGIPAGRYKIFVGQADDNSYATSAPGRVPYKRTFYSDATDPNDARVVEVSEGSTATDIDIRLGRTLPSFAVSGRVIDGETSKPLTGLRFGLRRLLKDGYASFNSSAPSNSQGEFRLENVTPGKYAVQVLPVQGSELRADPVPIEVVDQDVAGIIVKSSTGLSVSGTVVVEGRNEQSVLDKLTQLRLRAYVRNASGPDAFGQSSPIGTDGSFRLSGLGPGTAHFSLGSPDNQPLVNFSIQRLERNGVSQPLALEINHGEPITGLKIVVKYGTGSIRGEVKFENGPLPAGASVSVWIKKVDDTTQNVRPSNPDSRGHFLIEGVSAGNYELHVNAHLPGSRRPPPPIKQPITVTEGAVTQVAVTLDLASQPETPVP